jgi:HK97 gp10 family phage protein
MSDPDADLQKYFDALPDKVREKLAGKIGAIAEDLAEDIRSAAPQDSGRLRESVRVEDGRDELDKIVKAGGPLTTKEVRNGSGIAYDHALAIEFGTSKMPAQPFFWPTVRRRARDVHDQIEAAVKEALK